jgi:large subunit ribosomal protein L10
MPTPQKEQILRDTNERIRDVGGLFLADFSGMTVEKLSLLRKRCRDEQVQFRVIKNTLLKRAFNERGITALDEYLNGPTGLVFHPTDAVVPARILVDFAKENERPKVKAAVVDGRLFDDKAIAELATLPSREVLLGLVLATLIAPMTQFLAAVEAAVRLPVTMVDALERERSGTAA